MLVLQGLIRHGLHPEEAYSVEGQIDNYMLDEADSAGVIFSRKSPLTQFCPDPLPPRVPRAHCCLSIMSLIKSTHFT